MLPDADHSPASILKDCSRDLVSSAVSMDLLLPPIAVLLRPCPMNRASMPEATIDKDGDTSARKNDVGARSNTRGDGHVYSKAKSLCMKKRPDR
jgi:hypothetical protein